MGNGALWDLDENIKHNWKKSKLKNVYDKDETETSISDGET